MNNTNEEPKHEHDCDHCVFLGTHKDADLYICRDERETTHTYGGYMTDVGDWTVIKRYGELGDYSTSSAEAVRRAIAKGYLLEREALKEDGTMASWSCQASRIQRDGRNVTYADDTIDDVRSRRISYGHWDGTPKKDGSNFVSDMTEEMYFLDVLYDVGKDSRHEKLICDALGYVDTNMRDYTFDWEDMTNDTEL